MANQLITSSIVAKEALAVLENMLGFASMANRDWEDEFATNQSRGYSPGSTINIKRPPRYQYRAGRVAVPQATIETTVPLTLQQGGCDIAFTNYERTLAIQQLSGKIQAAMATVVNEIDRQGLALAHYATFNAIGVPGTLPNTQATAIGALVGVGQRLDEMAAPRDKKRGLVMNPAFNAAAVQGLSGLFNGAAQVTKQYGNGLLVDSLGLMINMDQNVDVHVNGSQPVASGTVNGAGQTGALVTVNAGTITGNITRGSKITFQGVFAVNPQSRVTTGSLAQFVVTADVAAGSTTIPIYPGIVTAGAFQNVTMSPANAAVMTIFGTANGQFFCNVGMHKDAFTLAMVPMAAPPKSTGVDAAVQTYKNMSIKVTDYYDGVNDNVNMRLDVLFGWAATYPELATIYAT